MSVLRPPRTGSTPADSQRGQGRKETMSAPYFLSSWPLPGGPTTQNGMRGRGSTRGRSPQTLTGVRSPQTLTGGCSPQTLICGSTHWGAAKCISQAPEEVGPLCLPSLCPQTCNIPGHTTSHPFREHPMSSRHSGSPKQGPPSPRHTTNSPYKDFPSGPPTRPLRGTISEPLSPSSSPDSVPGRLGGLVGKSRPSC